MINEIARNLTKWKLNCPTSHVGFISGFSQSPVQILSNLDKKIVENPNII
jgi:hypothetical protein